MRTLLMLMCIVIVAALSGCVRKIPIEQGNVITPEMVSELHNGMSRGEVEHVMGTPMVMNTFRENRMDYVYTYKPGRGVQTEKRVTLVFENDRVVSING
jgi:outer membrane protein assembly factor BamE